MMINMHLYLKYFIKYVKTYYLKYSFKEKATKMYANCNATTLQFG